MGHLQFCAGGQDITGDFYASDDATEVRAWDDDGTCLGAVTLEADNWWHASASAVINWTVCADDEYTTWQAALAALLAVGGLHTSIPESEWRL